MLDNMDQLKDYKKAFDFARLVTLASIGGALLVVSVLSIVFMVSYKNAKSRILVIDNQGNINYASETDVNSLESRTIEAKAHVSNFYSLIYELDEATYKEKMDKASYLAANCFKGIVSEHNSQQLHRKMVVENLHTESTIDSIFVDLKKMDGTIYGKQDLIYPAGTITRFMNCSFQIITYARSNKNPHGFKVENWKEFNNQTIKTITNY